jgi:inner membrane protein
MAFSGTCYLLPRLLRVPVTLDLIFYAVLLGSLFPDIDHPNALLPNHFAPLKRVSDFTDHRGIVHSLIASIAFGLAALGISLFFAFGVLVAFGFWFGYVTHLVADSMTRSGVKWLQPFDIDRKMKGPIQTGSLLEQTLFVLLIGVGSYLFLFVTL